MKPGVKKVLAIGGSAAAIIVFYVLWFVGAAYLNACSSSSCVSAASALFSVLAFGWVFYGLHLLISSDKPTRYIWITVLSFILFTWVFRIFYFVAVAILVVLEMFGIHS